MSEGGEREREMEVLGEKERTDGDVGVDVKRVEYLLRPICSRFQHLGLVLAPSIQAPCLVADLRKWLGNIKEEF